MKLKIALLATALTVTAAGMANAQMFGLGSPGDGVTPRSQNEMMQGPYVSLGGGVNWVQSSELTEPDEFETHDWLRFKTGWGVNGAVGWAFGFGPRIEAEFSYRRNHTTRNNDGCQMSRDSRLGQTGAMLNAAYDIFTGTRIVPYFGAGLGAVSSHLKVDKQGCDSEYVSDTQWRFAVQGFAGADFLVTQAMRIGLRYTFLHTNDLSNLHNEEGFEENVSLDPNSHAITLQIAYNFGAPRQIAAPPVAAPPPAPPMQRNFLVFFDFDKSDITPEADRVIVQAANNAKTASVTRITLTGHTDRAGPVAYNQRLSERRADAVKARLVREGIPAGSIVTIGRGESSPLVPTADGVREPQNRRVEIVL